MLERDTQAQPLQRRWYVNLRAVDLPVAVRGMRAQHVAATAVFYVLGKLTA